MIGHAYVCNASFLFLLLLCGRRRLNTRLNPRGMLQCRRLVCCVPHRRQPEFETRAAAVNVFGRYIPAMCLNNVLTDPQSKAKTVGLVRTKRFEQILTNVRRQAGASVADGDDRAAKL